MEAGETPEEALVREIREELSAEISVDEFQEYMAQTTDKGPGKRRPVDPMRHHRENGWDYRGRAIYHFTLPVEERYPLCGA